MSLITPEVIELSIISAALSLFLNFCYREGHIFSWWLDMWASLFMIIESKEDLDYPEGVNRRDYRFSQIESRLFKPLGYCVVCQNTWVALIIGCFTWNIFDILLIILLSSLMVRYIHGRLL